MTEIPEHLRKRAEEARKKAEAKAAGGADAPAEPAAADGRGRRARSQRGGQQDPRAPARAVARRAKAARRRRDRRGGGGDRHRGGHGAGRRGRRGAGRPLATGPGGHTQRLLTVVKSGSIQDVKATPQDKVHVWPHLLVVEFVAALACTAFTLVFSIFVNAPLLELANPNQTPNPSKAPVVLPGPPGAADDVPPDGRRRDHARVSASSC